MPDASEEEDAPDVFERTDDGDGAGTIDDTYVAALQHELVDVSAADRLVGVVRRPTRWFSAAIDENRPAVGPPDELLDGVKERHEALKLRGMCDEGAHNAAWEETGFEERYRSFLDADEAARATVQELADRVRSGENLVLVCYENTNKKRCHRTVLKARLEAQV